MGAREAVCENCGGVIHSEVHSAWGALEARSWVHEDGFTICDGVTSDTPVPFPRAVPAAVPA